MKGRGTAAGFAGLALLVCAGCGRGPGVGRHRLGVRQLGRFFPSRQTRELHQQPCPPPVRPVGQPEARHLGRRGGRVRNGCAAASTLIASVRASYNATTN